MYNVPCAIYIDGGRNIMIAVTILCVGKLKERYWTEACEEYAKRLKGSCQFRIAEVEEERMPDKFSPAHIRHTLEKEGQRLLAAIPKGAFVTALCIEGRLHTSEELAQAIEEAAVSGCGHIVFIIGGSWGLSDAVKKAARLHLSMSRMTFPHQLARVMLCEQIYRAFQINGGGQYHK